MTPPEQIRRDQAMAYGATRDEMVAAAYAVEADAIADTFTLDGIDPGDWLRFLELRAKAAQAQGHELTPEAVVRELQLRGLVP